MIERVPYCVWPKPTPTNPERIEAWRRKYARVPIDLQCAPVRKLDPGDPTPHTSACAGRQGILK